MPLASDKDKQIRFIRKKEDALPLHVCRLAEYLFYLRVAQQNLLNDCGFVGSKLLRYMLFCCFSEMLLTVLPSWPRTLWN